jgi:hypothetical protein
MLVNTFFDIYHSRVFRSRYIYVGVVSYVLKLKFPERLKDNKQIKKFIAIILILYFLIIKCTAYCYLKLTLKEL